jgi:VWFA-related protein
MRGIVALVLTVSAISAGSQQEIPHFRSGVDVVQFTVTVTDKDRHPISGLAASDFEVLVDGAPRPLAAFAAVTLPADPSGAATSIPPVAPDVLTNQLAPEGRLVVIVMDRSTPDGQPMQAAHAIANAAIERLGPNDLAAVVYTGRASRKYSQGLTADRARLHAAANRLSVGELNAAPGAPSLAAAIASHGAPQKIDQLERSVPLASGENSGECNCGVCVIDSLTALAKALTGAMGRQKSILFVGSDIAIAVDVRNATGRCAAYIYPARDKLTRALDAANVTFHVIDPRGLEVESSIFRQQALEVLPDYTGGRTVLNNNKPQDAIGPIFDESRSYYVLAVARDAAVAGGADRHQIKVSVKQSGAIVRARNLSFAADPKKEPTPAGTGLAGALKELLPGGDFSLQMNLVAQFAADGSPEVRVLLAADSAIAGKLDAVIATYDRVFTLVGTPLKQRLDVPPGAVAGGAAFQWTSMLKPPPGEYEVRAAVATADGKRAAHVIGYVDVPDAKKEAVALSGIIVKSGGAPTVRRDFTAGDAVGLSFQVAHAKGESAKAAVQYLLKDELGQPIANATVPHERAVPVAPGVDGYDIGVRLPAGPGRYVVTIEVSDGRRAARREVPLRVR